MTNEQEKDFVCGNRKCPSNWIAISDSHDWIDLANTELLARGETINLSREQKNIEKLNQKLNEDEFYKLKFSFKYGNKYFIYSYRLIDEQNKKCVHSNAYDVFGAKWKNDTLIDMSADSFFEQLKEFRIGAWKKSYNSLDYGIAILDGASWNLEIKFVDGKKQIFSGMNAFPCNFFEVFKYLNIDFDSNDWKDVDCEQDF